MPTPEIRKLQDWLEADPSYFALLKQQGRAASANNLSYDDCPYAGDTVERTYWMDGFDEY